jgi:hypothetical protein
MSLIMSRDTAPSGYLERHVKGIADDLCANLDQSLSQARQ